MEKYPFPSPQIELPKFIFGDNQQKGVGQGDGEQGDPVPGQGQPQKGDGKGEAGQEAGQHSLEVEVRLEELAQMLGEELELPKIQPKGSKSVEAKGVRYNSVLQQGPQSLRHYKRTYKEALKRQIAAGMYDPDNPVIVPIKSDFRYRGWSEEVIPQTNAAIIYIMDVSGSMGDEQKEIVRTEAFWIDTWLQSQYKGVDRRFIIHDATAKEVEEEVFFSTRESGGTLISSAYKLLLNMIQADYSSADWNIYPFHFSDGDNWSADDTKSCLSMLRGEIVPRVNQFSYGQVESRYGSGQFFKDLMEHFQDEDQIVATRIPDKNAIYESIKVFLGRGQ